MGEWTKKWEQLAAKVAWRAVKRAPGLAFEDALQEAHRGLLVAEETFDPAGGSKEMTWAYTHAWAKAQVAIAQHFREMPGMRTRRCAEDQLCPSHEDDVRREELHALLVDQIRQLPNASDRRVMLLYLQGMSLADVQRRTSLSKQRISAIFRRATTTLRQRLEKRGESWQSLSVES